jgi:hypothetical protein
MLLKKMPLRGGKEMAMGIFGCPEVAGSSKRTSISITRSRVQRLPRSQTARYAMDRRRTYVVFLALGEFRQRPRLHCSIGHRGSCD